MDTLEMLRKFPFFPGVQRAHFYKYDIATRLANRDGPILQRKGVRASAVDLIKVDDLLDMPIENYI